MHGTHGDKCFGIGYLFHGCPKHTTQSHEFDRVSVTDIRQQCPRFSKAIRKFRTDISSFMCQISTGRSLVENTSSICAVRNKHVITTSKRCFVATIMCLLRSMCFGVLVPNGARPPEVTVLTAKILIFRILLYNDVIMGVIASQITNLTIVYSTVYSDADQRKHQSSASLAFVRGIHRWTVNSPHKWPVTRKMFPFDDVIMYVAVKC